MHNALVSVGVVAGAAGLPGGIVVMARPGRMLHLHKPQAYNVYIGSSLHYC